MHLLFADTDGKIYDHPTLEAAARTGEYLVAPEDGEMMPLPEGASLVMLPERVPVGMVGEEFSLALDPEGKGPVYAVAALLPQGYTRTLLPAFRPEGQGMKPLPLYGYTAAAWHEGNFWVAAVKSDEGDRWNPVHYSTEELPALVKQGLAENPGNRILKQLSRCALEYQCFTAQNIFYRRWEGGVPVSPQCNAACLGCISEQPAECCPSPQVRIDFEPTVEEVVALGIPHLEGPQAILSFGQGCEGEPSLAAKTISGAIQMIREKTEKGTININSNAGNGKGLLEIAAAGLDSIRVTMISADPATYQKYHRPRGFALDNIEQTILKLKALGIFISINLLTWPGLTDRDRESEAWLGFLARVPVDMIQLRNLNADPDYLWQALAPEFGEVLGINNLIKIIKNEFAQIKIGSFSPSLR